MITGVLFFVLIGIWWIWFREEYKLDAILLYYLFAILAASTVLGIAILIFPKRVDEILTIAQWVAPLSGILGIASAGLKGRLRKGSDQFAHEDER